jgi:uncharacterized protein YbjT (DUF2867 family)
MSQSSPLILAIGAAGKFAGMVVPELAKRGANVRGFVRSPDEKKTPMAAGAAAVVIGDLVDEASVRAAMKGVDRVFYIAPAFLPHEAEVGVRVVEAAKDAGVRRFVFSSVIHPTLSALGNHAEKGPVEEALLSSGMEYTFLHPTVFFQNFSPSWPSVVKTGVFAEPWSADTRFSRVDYRDVAEVAAIALTEDRLLLRDLRTVRGGVAQSPRGRGDHGRSPRPPDQGRAGRPEDGRRRRRARRAGARKDVRLV